VIVQLAIGMAAVSAPEGLARLAADGNPVAQMVLRKVADENLAIALGMVVAHRAEPACAEPEPCEAGEQHG